MDLYWFGTQSIDDTPDMNLNVSSGSTERLENCDLATLKQLVAQSNSELIGFANGELFPQSEQWRAASLLREREQVEATVLFSGSLMSSIWQTGRFQTASLVASPAQFGAVLFNRVVLEQLLNQASEIGDPLWWATVQLAKQDGIIFLSAGNEDYFLPEALPQLAPVEATSEMNWVHSAVRDLCSSTNIKDALQRVELQAGLLQMHDFLDASHRASQSVEGESALADHWHGINHRREPDYFNSKYWFRQVGASPIYDELAQLAEKIVEQSDIPAEWKQKLGAGSNWNPNLFVDFCAECERTANSEMTETAQRIQYAEMLLLIKESI